MPPKTRQKAKLSELPALPAPSKDASASTSTGKSRFTSPDDYAMSVSSPAVLPQPSQIQGSLTLDNIKQTWASLAESASEELPPLPPKIEESIDDSLQDAQTQSFSASDFEQWCKLMGYTKQVKSSSPSPVVISSPTPSQSVVASTSTGLTPCTMQLASSQTHSLESTPNPSRFSSIPEPVFLKNSKVIKLFQMEPKFWNPNPQLVARQLLAPDSNFLQKSSKCTQRYYEFILVDNGSVSFSPHKDKGSQSFVTNTSVQIHSVLSPTDWRSHPRAYKKFSKPFDPMIYNYWDYQEAWINTFTLQNHLYTHSWFFYFNKKKPAQFQFPHWFLNQWWPCYGPTIDILPPPIREGYEYFKTRFHLPQSHVSPLLLFFSIFKLAWIYQQRFCYFKDPDQFGLPYLALQGHCKWWKDWNAQNVSVSAIERWFFQNPKYLCPTAAEQTTFLQQKSIAAATLAASGSKADYLQHMEKIIQQLRSKVSAEQNPPASSATIQIDQKDPEVPDYCFE